MAFQDVHAYHEEQRQKQERYYNRQVKVNPYQSGDVVWMNDATTQRKKLDPNWTGPYKVVSSNEKGILYKLMDLKHPQAVPRVIHYDRLKPYGSHYSAEPVDDPVPLRRMETSPRIAPVVLRSEATES